MMMLHTTTSHTRGSADPHRNNRLVDQETSANSSSQDFGENKQTFTDYTTSLAPPKRSQSQDRILSQSLGAYPSLLLRDPQEGNRAELHRHISDSISKIYHAGYLLKRSNNPVQAPTGGNKTLSPTSRLLHQRIHHASATMMEVANTDDVFAADWEEETMEGARRNNVALPVLPLSTSPDLEGSDDINLAEDYNNSDLPSYGLAPRQSHPSREIIADEEMPFLSATASSTGVLQTQTGTRSVVEAGTKEESESNYSDEEENQQLLQNFWSMAADFFGVPPPEPIHKDSTADLTADETTTQTSTRAMPARAPIHHDSSTESLKSKRRSAPIKMPIKMSTTSTTATTTISTDKYLTGSPAFYQRAQSEVLQEPRQDLHSTQLADVFDDQGHVWRSKYCVLQDGVLYFYRNQDDAESQQAKNERIESISDDELWSPTTNNSPLTSKNIMASYDALGKSPMPSKLVVSPTIPGEARPQHFWEKRVRVESIGAVRSAEAEYGEHCFALLSPPSDGDDAVNRQPGDSDDDDDNMLSIESAEDKLILRARDGDEMSEWLFQFHRSIALYVKNLIQNTNIHAMDFASPEHNATLVNPVTPSVLLPPIPHRHVTLSHGHGRTLARRRRPKTHKPGQGTDVITPPRRLKQRSEDAINWFASSSVVKMDPNMERIPSSSTVGTAPTSTPSTSASTFLSPSSPLQQLATLGPSPRSPNGSSQPSATPRTETRAGLDRQDQSDLSPEFVAPPSADPETERPPPAKNTGGKYIPPHLRRKKAQQQQPTEETSGPVLFKPANKYIPPHLRNKKSKAVTKPLSPAEDRSPTTTVETSTGTQTEIPVPQQPEKLSLKLGGCADPRVVAGSIMDSAFIPRKASKLKRELRTDPYGFRKTVSSTITWDVGAVSECGIRDSNEDSYLIAGNLLESLENNGRDSGLNNYSLQHPPGLFCIFDGHLGDQAARYSAERFTTYLEVESRTDEHTSTEEESASVFAERIMRQAIQKLDLEFCQFCVEDGRQWESGSTALIAALIDNHLVVGNLGDARAVASRSVDTDVQAAALYQEGWSSLPESDSGGSRSCMWKEICHTHSPSRKDERNRIEAANGWITFERQIPIAQLHRLNLQDKDVFDILQRCFADRYQTSPKAAAPQRVMEISRVCGELAVSRALGDRDFKAAFNHPNTCGEDCWDSPLFLSFPDEHNHCFSGDLIVSTPEFCTLRVGEATSHQEFFLFACDGLFDVMDPDDAVRVTRDLLFVKKWPARQAAARLAELAVHLGSSDNITVIVVAFDDSQQI